MPIIKIRNLPAEIERDGHLKLFEKFVKEAVSNISKMKIGPEAVKVFTSSASNETGYDVIVFAYIFKRAERSKDVRDTLAMKIGDVILCFAPTTENIECFVRPLDPEDGFWTNELGANRQLPHGKDEILPKFESNDAVMVQGPTESARGRIKGRYPKWRYYAQADKWTWCYDVEFGVARPEGFYFVLIPECFLSKAQE